MKKPTPSGRKLGPGATALDRELTARGVTNNVELARHSGYDRGYIRGVRYATREATPEFKRVITRAARIVLHDLSIEQSTLFPERWSAAPADGPPKRFERLTRAEWEELDALIARNPGLSIDRGGALQLPPLRPMPSTPNP